MSESPIQLRGKSGGVVFDGTQSPGGGSQPVQATYSGGNVDIPNGGGANLTFDSLDSGTELLDRTDPANPLFLTAGTYAVMAHPASTAPLTSGGHALLALGGVGPITANANTAWPDDGWSACVVGQAAAGDTLTALVFNIDGAAQRTYTIGGVTLVKLA